jgi:hypothetical protein
VCVCVSVCLFCVRLFVCVVLSGVPFPKDFEGRLKNIYKRLFRVYAHMYHSHIEKIISLGVCVCVCVCVCVYVCVCACMCGCVCMLHHTHVYI